MKSKFAKDLFLKNCVPVDADRVGVLSDILVLDGMIAALAPCGAIAAPPGIPAYDAAGAYAAPALIDIHTHLRDPGFPEKEDIESGTAAAAAGGYGTVVPMPNTDPVTDSPAVLARVLRDARERGHCRVLPAAAITVGQRGGEVTDFAALTAAGAAAFSDDGRPVSDKDVMRQAMQIAAAQEALLISHSEELSLTGAGVINEGTVSAALGLPGIPNAAEDEAVRREIALCRETGAHLHIAHISTAGSVAALRAAKQEGLTVTGETCPHYFVFCDEDVPALGVNGKMKPPLRAAVDREAVIAALADGTLDCIATDHAPHTARDKGTLAQGAFGILGLQTAFAAAYTTFVRSGRMPLPALIRCMSTAPAMILGLEDGRGFLDYGAASDLVVFDGEPFTFDEKDIKSKSKNTPFIGMELSGRIRATFVGGEQTYGGTTDVI